jgi:archaellum component FlaC
MALKSHIMDKKTTHDTKIVVECQQGEAFKKINERLEKTDDRIEIMDKGFGKMVMEVCEKVDALSDKFDDALFPSKLHPDNGLINNVKRLGEDMSIVKGKIGDYDRADVLNNLTEVKKEISKFKIQVTTIAAITSVIIVLIELYFKIKGNV